MSGSEDLFAGLDRGSQKRLRDGVLRGRVSGRHYLGTGQNRTSPFVGMPGADDEIG